MHTHMYASHICIHKCMHDIYKGRAGQATAYAYVCTMSHHHTHCQARRLHMRMCVMQRLGHGRGWTRGRRAAEPPPAPAAA